MNARIILSVCVVCSVILTNYARADDGRPSKCEELIKEALHEYYEKEEKTADGMQAIEHGTPDSSRCIYLQGKVPSQCLAETNMCIDTTATTHKRNSATQPKSNQASRLNNSGRKLRPGKRSTVVKRSLRQKRSLEYECYQPPANCANKGNDLYRTLNGTCNNLVYGRWEWGMADRVQSGFLWADYNYGNSPRTYSSYWPYWALPSARKVSNIIHEAGAPIQEDPTRSLTIMQMGQFLAHDMILTEMSNRSDGEPLKCCPGGADAGNPECYPIFIPTNENYFTPGGCLNFARSHARLNCDNGVREQVNEHTSYLDLSMVYGVSDEEMISLRTLSGGLLKTVLNKLPKDDTDSLCELSMAADDTNYYCPIAGDIRVSETPGLASLHTIWVREHNRLANGLAARHASWNDETLFQEARKIAIAEWQHIVYNEYLPATIGTAAMVANNLNVAPTGYKDTYSQHVDATITNSFGAAVMRFGHTLVPDKIALAQVDNEAIIQEGNLKNNFFEPLFYHGNGHKGTDNILKWTSTQRCPLSDRKIQPSVQRFLFLDSNNDSLDLSALNIQRGRDHGVPPYNDFRQYVCGLPRAYHFGVGYGGLIHHTSEVATLLSQAYNYPDEIDLFTGHLSEIRLQNSQLGPTGQCLFIKQFKRLRDGDRFFYERQTSNPSITFTPDQLSEIKSVRMSTLFCLNTEAKAGKRIPQNMFFVQSAGNDYVNCSAVQGIDLDDF